jgi:hypothetical protein
MTSTCSKASHVHLSSFVQRQYKDYIFVQLYQRSIFNLCEVYVEQIKQMNKLTQLKLKMVEQKKVERRVAAQCLNNKLYN